MGNTSTKPVKHIKWPNQVHCTVKPDDKNYQGTLCIEENKIIWKENSIINIKERPGSIATKGYDVA